MKIDNAPVSDNVVRIIKEKGYNNVPSLAKLDILGKCLGTW